MKRLFAVLAIVAVSVAVAPSVARAESCPGVIDRRPAVDTTYWACSGKGAWYFRGWMLCQQAFPYTGTKGIYTPWHFKGKAVTTITFYGSCTSAYPVMLDRDWQSQPA